MLVATPALVEVEDPRGVALIDLTKRGGIRQGQPH
jgi:hypothetical protein